MRKTRCRLTKGLLQLIDLGALKGDDILQAKHFAVEQMRLSIVFHLSNIAFVPEHFH